MQVHTQVECPGRESLDQLDLSQRKFIGDPFGPIGLTVVAPNRVVVKRHVHMRPPEVGTGLEITSLHYDELELPDLPPKPPVVTGLDLPVRDADDDRDVTEYVASVELLPAGVIVRP